jgi:hypothetical protein
MRLQGETRELPVVLTDEELLTVGADLAAAVDEAAEAEIALAAWEAGIKSSREARKGEIKRLRADQEKLGETIQTGKDKRDVPCAWLYALPAGYAFLLREDTQELVTHRKLRDEERQMEIGEAPYREPTPEQLAEWLANLPVNEADALPEGHAGDVQADDHDPLLDPGGFASDTTDEDGNTLGGDDDWDDPALDTEEEILEQEIDDVIVTDEFGEPLDEPLSAGATTPRVPTPALDALVAMPEDEAAALVRRNREAAGIRVPDEEF